MTTDAGRPPRQSWSHPLEGRLTHAALAWETEEVLVADDAGGLYLFDRDGTLKHLTRGYAGLRDLAISADGERALVVFEDRNMALFDRNLRSLWTKPLYDTILGVALDPFARHMAFATAGGRLHIMTTTKREIAELELTRPVRHVRFAMTHPYLNVAAEDGLLASIDFWGRIDWEERLFTTAGDLAINGNGSMILLAGFAHGIQRYNADGNNQGTFVVNGSPSLVSTSFSGEEIACATLERQIFRIDRRGKVIWRGTTSDDIVSIGLGATGQSLVVGLAEAGISRLDWHKSAAGGDDF